MARTTQITFGQIAQIADQMKAAGTRPTARAVRERIGSGSMGTIHKLLQQWNGKASGADDEENEGAELPAHIQNALMDFIGTEIATACEPINEKLQAAKEAAEHLAEENERLELVIDRLQQERDEAQRHQATSAALYKRATDDLETATSQLAQKAEILSARAIEAEKAQAVLSAQLTAKTEQANELNERLKTAEHRANAQTEELKQANNHYQACAARLEAADREIESLRKPKATPTKKGSTE